MSDMLLKRYSVDISYVTVMGNPGCQDCVCIGNPGYPIGFGMGSPGSKIWFHVCPRACARVRVCV